MHATNTFQYTATLLQDTATLFTYTYWERERPSKETRASCTTREPDANASDQHIEIHCNTLQHTTQPDANASDQHIEIHYNTLQQTMEPDANASDHHIEILCNTLQHTREPDASAGDQHIAIHCTLQHTTHTHTHCNTLQHTATHCNTKHIRIRIAIHCNALQRTATHCNALQRTATHYTYSYIEGERPSTETRISCTTREPDANAGDQHIEIHCNTLQHTTHTHT